MAKKKQPRRRMYTCDDCGTGQLLHWTAFNRASRPQCPACGCARLTASKPATEENIEKQRHRVEGLHGSMVPSNSFNARKKVT